MNADKAIFTRDLHFDFQDIEKHDWYNGDPLRTTYCDALSPLFPEGERFFIRSVKQYVDRIEDPKLKEDIRNFCIQEALHTREHEAYNEHLAAYGYDIEKMEERVKKAISRAKTPLKKLALTVAIEHLTSTLSHVILKDPKLLENSTPVYRNLWTWHSLEEIEHKGVAFDVYQQVTQHLSPWKRYALRTSVLFLVTIDIHRLLMTNFFEMMRHRKASLGPKMWAKSAWMLFGRPGYYRRAFLYYLKFYMPFFHPWKGDDGELVRQGRERLDAMLKSEIPDAG